jgi:hypothetical protein
MICLLDFRVLKCLVRLYAKFEKCEFGVTKVDFLGHKITQESLKMDDYKVKAILD